jgi:hypothetical protein
MFIWVSSYDCAHLTPGFMGYESHTLPLETAVYNYLHTSTFLWIISNTNTNIDGGGLSPP